MTSATAEQRTRAEQMLELHRSLLFGMLREAIRQERPDLAPVFDEGARRSRRPQWFERATAAAKDPLHAMRSSRDLLAARRAANAKREEA